MIVTNGHAPDVPSADSQGTERREDFPGLLRGFRERSGRSRNNLAHEVGVDPSYLTRIEHGDRAPARRHIVEALIRTLRLSIGEADSLLVAAGHSPESVVLMGAWPRALQAVSEVLNDSRLSPEDREAFSAVVEQIAEKWRRAGGTR